MSEPTAAHHEGETAASTPPQRSQAAKLVAPIAGLVATAGVRAALDRAYRSSTGHAPPRANDPQQSLRRVLVWAALSAAVIAVVQVVIDRASARWSD